MTVEPNRGGRPPKRLIDHVLGRTFQPKRHGTVLLGESLPLRPPHPDPSPAMKRLWARLRELQSEYREVSSVEVRYDIVLAFSHGVEEYMGAVVRSSRDPLKDLDGLAEIIECNRRARRNAAAAEARAASRAEQRRPASR